MKSEESFYSTCIEYLEQWREQFEDIKVCQWILLNNLLTWPEVEGSLDFILKNKPDFKIDDVKLFDEISCMEKIHDWETKKTSALRKWVEIFAHFKPHGNICKIIEYSFWLPASNAPTERIFSWLNNLLSCEKTQLSLEI